MMKLYYLTTTKKELDVAIDYTYPQKSSWKSSSEARALTLMIEEGSKKLWEINVPIRIVFAQKTLKATSLANFWLLSSCDLFSFDPPYFYAHILKVRFQDLKIFLHLLRFSSHALSYPSSIVFI